MAEKLVSQAVVAYGDVDWHERLLLSRLFKLLQDAAIAHANQFGAGTNAVTARAESWVLNRIQADITRFPSVGEPLRIETWSTGIRRFKGYRDFRVYDEEEQTIVVASSVWLYISLQSKSIVRVPPEIAEIFPVGKVTPAFPQLEGRDFDPPGTGVATWPVTVRYGDVDVNQHVNNAAYFDYLQTALARAGGSVYPRSVALNYLRAISPVVESVSVRYEPLGDEGRLSIENASEVFALGAVRWGASPDHAAS